MNEAGYSNNGIFHNGVRAALVIAHPGHELCIYGWLKLVRPRVFILTDGSGHSGSSRLSRTSGVLTGIGAEPGSFYGRFSDIAIYDALLNHQIDLFLDLARELAAQITSEKINCVVGDAREGYNPTHDVCRLVIDAAVEMARQTNGHEISNLQFSVTGRPNACPTGPQTQPICLNLDESMFEQKLVAARNYPELRDELESLIRSHSEESFRNEYLYPVNDDDNGVGPDLSDIFYEKYGEARVKEGYYKQVIRYHEHVLPLALSLKQAAKK